MSDERGLMHGALSHGHFRAANGIAPGSVHHVMVALQADDLEGALQQHPAAQLIFARGVQRNVVRVDLLCPDDALRCYISLEKVSSSILIKPS